MNLSLSDPGLLKSQAYIDGQWIDADSGETFAVTNPANGELITEVARLGATETARAIAAADRAMQGWKLLPAKSRAGILRKWFDLMMEAPGGPGASSLTAEQGKAAGGGPRRNRLRCKLYRVVWLKKAKRVVRRYRFPTPAPDKRLVVYQATGWRGGVPLHHGISPTP